MLALALAALALAAWAGDAPGAFCRALAVSSLESNAPHQALKWTARAVRLGRNDAASHLVSARALAWQARTSEALQAVQRAEALGASADQIAEHTDLILAKRGDLAAAKRLLARETLASPRAALEAVVRCALFLNQHEWASAVLGQWESRFPDDAFPHYLQGRLGELREQREAALAAYQRARAKQPTLSAAAFRMGVVQRQQRQFADAAAAFQACFGSPLEPIARVEAADCLSHIGRTEEAWAALKPLAPLEPRRALALYREVDEFTEDDRAALVAGRILAAQNSHHAAIEQLERALDFNPRNIEARSRLAASLRRVGRIAEADEQTQIHRRHVRQRSQIVALLSRLDDAAEDWEMRCDLADLYLQCDSLAMAELQLQQVLAAEPEMPRAHCLLAEVYREKAKLFPEFLALAKTHERRGRAGKKAAPDRRCSQTDAP